MNDRHEISELMRDSCKPSMPELLIAAGKTVCVLLPHLEGDFDPQLDDVASPSGDIALLLHEVKFSRF